MIHLDFCTLKILKQSKQATYLEKVFALTVTDKRLVSKINKIFLQDTKTMNTTTTIMKYEQALTEEEHKWQTRI